MPGTASDNERKLAELAVQKVHLAAQLHETREQMKVLSKKVDLPLIMVLNGDAVMVSPPPTSFNPMPVCKVARCVS